MSSDAPLVDARELTKTYRMYRRPADRLLQLLLRRDASRYAQEVTVVKGVDLKVQPGEAVGILGANGAGKSTLLQMIAGTLTPTSGTCKVRGRVSALLELGSGFNPEFTGRENVFLNGAILGIPEDEMRRRFDEIVAFADIGGFLEQPVKTYSSGMFVRLAFAVAISVSPQLLIVDEALSVGDVRFQARCMTRIRQMRESGVSILFVSHDVEAVKRICDRALVMESGAVVREGPAGQVGPWYLARMIGDRMETGEVSASEPPAAAESAGGQAAPAGGDGSPAPPAPAGLREVFPWLRHGDGGAEVLSAELIRRDGTISEVAELDERITLRFDVVFHQAVESCGFGFYLRDRLGTDVIGINTFQERVPMGPVQAGDRLRLTFTFALQVRPGHYGLSPSLAYSQEELRFMDWVHNLAVIEVVDPTPEHMVFGLYHPAVETSVVQLHA